MVNEFDSTSVGSDASYGAASAYPMVEEPRWGTVTVSAALMVRSV